jgi:hypothetical protein
MNSASELISRATRIKIMEKISGSAIEFLMKYRDGIGDPHDPQYIKFWKEWCIIMSRSLSERNV